MKTPKKPVPHLDVTAGVIWKDERFLITLRPPKGLLGGLWEFPGGKLEAGETLEACLIREIHEELEIDIRVERKSFSMMPTTAAGSHPMSWMISPFPARIGR